MLTSIKVFNFGWNILVDIRTCMLAIKSIIYQLSNIMLYWKDLCLLKNKLELIKNHYSSFLNVPSRFILLSWFCNASISLFCEVTSALKVFKVVTSVFRVVTCDFNDATSCCRASIWLSKVFGSLNNNRRSMVRISLSSLQQVVVRQNNVKMTNQVSIIKLKTWC